MLLHFGRADANDARFSFVMDKIEVRLVAEDGPEFGPITVLILVDLLLVKLIREPFDSPALVTNHQKEEKYLVGVIN